MAIPTISGSMTLRTDNAASAIGIAHGVPGEPSHGRQLSAPSTALSRRAIQRNGSDASTFCTPSMMRVGSLRPAFAQDQAPLPSPEELNAADTSPSLAAARSFRIMRAPTIIKWIPAAAIRGKVGGISFFDPRHCISTSISSTARARSISTSGRSPACGSTAPARSRTTSSTAAATARRAIEVGGVRRRQLQGLTNPYDSLGVRLDVVKDIANAHQSTIFSPNVEFSTPLSRSFYVSASVSAPISSATASPIIISASRRPRRALERPARVQRRRRDEELEGRTARQLRRCPATCGTACRCSASASYSRLVGDFKRSPIVSQRGSASQWLGALGLAYTW